VKSRENQKFMADGTGEGRVTSIIFFGTLEPTMTSGHGHCIETKAESEYVRFFKYVRLESDVTRMKECPREMNQSSAERRNAKANPVRKSSRGDHRLVASLVTIVLEPACFIHRWYAPFGDDATIICTEKLKRESLGSQLTKATMCVSGDQDGGIASAPFWATW
jgi:hypothetical protein